MNFQTKITRIIHNMKNFFTKKIILICIISFSFFNGVFSQSQEKINFELLDAVFDNNLFKVDSLLKLGADVNYAGYDKIPALHYAVYNNNNEIINLLLDFNADIEKTDYRGLTALNLAASIGNDSLVYFFIMKNAIIDTIDNEGNSPLHNAVYSGNFIAVDMLLFYGAATETINNEYKTPLLSAVEIANYEMTFSLLSHRANPNYISKDKKSAVLSAIKNQDIDILILLKHYGADFSIKNNKNQNLIDIAVFTGNLKLVETIKELSNLSISDLNNQNQIWKEVLYERNFSKFNSLEKLGLKRPKKLIYGGFHLNQSIIFNSENTYNYAGFGIHELNYNFRFNTSFGNRYSTKRKLIEYEPNNFYIVNSLRYFINFELEKIFQIYRTQKGNKFNLIASLGCPIVKDKFKDIKFNTDFYFSYSYGLGLNYSFSNSKSEIYLNCKRVQFKGLNESPIHLNLGYSLKLFKI